MSPWIEYDTRLRILTRQNTDLWDINVPPKNACLIWGYSDLPIHASLICILNIQEKNIKLCFKLSNFLFAQLQKFYPPPLKKISQSFYRTWVRFKLNLSAINNDTLFWLLYLTYCMCYTCNCQKIDHSSGSFLLFVFANNLEKGTCSKLLHSHKPIITLECLNYLPVKSVTRNFIIATTELDLFILMTYPYTDIYFFLKTGSFYQFYVKKKTKTK